MKINLQVFCDYILLPESKQKDTHSRSILHIFNKYLP